MAQSVKGLTRPRHSRPGIPTGFFCQHAHAVTIPIQNLTNLTPSEQFFLRSLQVLSQLRNSQCFATVFTKARHFSWARSIQSTPPFYFLKTQFNIIFTYKPRSFKYSLWLRFPHPHSLCASPLLSSPHCLSHSPPFSHSFPICPFSCTINFQTRTNKSSLPTNFTILAFTATCFGYKNVAIFRELQNLRTYAASNATESRKWWTVYTCSMIVQLGCNTCVTDIVL